jgi:serine/threonine protein kinase
VVQGLLLGTLRYMAPEQVKGEHTDFRTDIYAFGLVLFEMLTGRQALDGHDHEPASLARALPSAPGWLHDLVARCLTANPDERWQTARDILLETTGASHRTHEWSALVDDAAHRGARREAQHGQHATRPRRGRASSRIDRSGRGDPRDARLARRAIAWPWRASGCFQHK